MSAGLSTEYWAEIDKMLSVIPADISRGQWLSVAMGIHHFDYLSSEKLGYSKFLEWSKTGEHSFHHVLIDSGNSTKLL
jgi:hypothetical protein